MVSSRFTFPVAQPVVSVGIAEAFMAFPIAMVKADACQQERMREIYQVAYERARELHRPSRWARLYLPSWN